MKLQRQVLDMLLRYGVKGETDIACVPYYPQKTDCFSTRTPQRYWPRTMPEAVGISSFHMMDMLAKIEAQKGANVHTVLVVRNGKVICDASAPGYSTTTWALTHSMAKTITALAIGQAIDRGYLTLQTKLADLLGDECPYRMHPRIKAITVWHLLSMSTGVTEPGEVTSAVSSNWQKDYLEATPTFDPGTDFHYNSMNSYMLSVMLKKATGKGLGEWLTQYLWRPMGVRNFMCEKSPQGIEKGGWGMYIAPEDLAKVGQLILQKGKWDGEQLISESFMEQLTKKTFATKDMYGDFDYALHTWVSQDNATWLLSGMLGQNVWICPKNQTVVVLTSGNNDIFERSAILHTIADYLGPSFTPTSPGKATRQAKRDYAHAQAHFYEKNRWAIPCSSPSPLMTWWLRVRRKPVNPLPEACKQYIGNYTFARNNAGVLPLFVRFMQNNHTKGLSRMSIFCEQNKCFVAFDEGTQNHVVEVGFYHPAKSEMNFAGEHYLVYTTGQATVTEDGNPVLKIEMVFPEIPNTRRIKIYPEGNTFRLTMSERPGKQMIDGLIDKFVPESFRAGGIVGFLRNKIIGADPFEAIGPMMEPSLYGVKELPEKQRKPTPPQITADLTVPELTPPQDTPHLTEGEE